MAQYMFSAYSDEGEARSEMSEEEMQQGWQKIMVLEEEMKSAEYCLCTVGSSLSPSYTRPSATTTDRRFVGPFSRRGRRQLDMAGAAR